MEDTKVKYKTLFSLAQNEGILTYNYSVTTYNQYDIPQTPNTRNYISGEYDTLYDQADWGNEKSVTFSITIPNPFITQDDYTPKIGVVWNGNT